MNSANWTNKWILMFLAGLIFQAILYPYLAFLKPLEFSSHPFFYDVAIISFASLIIQVIGFLIIMNKTKDEDPAIYGQGRPFQHKLREEDTELADRKPTHAE